MAALRPAIPAPIMRTLRGVWGAEGKEAEGILRGQMMGSQGRRVCSVWLVTSTERSEDKFGWKLRGSSANTRNPNHDGIQT